MFKIIEFAIKELKLIKKQKMSSLLVFLYPLIIVLVLFLALGNYDITSPIFGKPGIELITIGAYYPEQTINHNSEYMPSFDYKEFFSRINDSDNINIILYNSEKDVLYSVYFGEVDLGILFEPSLDSSKPPNVKLVYDDAAPLFSPQLLSLTESKIKQIANETSVGALKVIWADLTDMREQLKSQISELDDYKKTLRDSKYDLRILEHKLDDIDFTSIENNISSFNNSYDSYDSSLETSLEDIKDAEKKIDIYDAELLETRSELLGYRQTLVSWKSQIGLIKLSSPEPMKSQLADVETEIDAQITKIDNTISKIDTIRTELNATKIKLANAKTKLIDTQNKLYLTKIQVSNMSDTVSNAKDLVENSKELISSTKEMQDTSMSSLEENKKMVNDFVDNIDDLRNVSPDVLVSPLSIVYSALFNIRKLELMLVISVVVVLLLISILMAGVSTVLEREEGMAFRVQMSPTSKFSWALGKLLGQIIFVSIISILIILISMFVLGISMKGNPLDLLGILILIPLSFVCLGLAIARFANSFSAVVLGSFLIIIPMLFLSGSFFPLEFMPAGIAFISKYLPLTLGKDLLVGVMLKGMPLGHLLNEIYAMISYSLVFFAIYLFGRKI